MSASERLAILDRIQRIKQRSYAITTGPGYHRGVLARKEIEELNEAWETLVLELLDGRP